MPGFWLFKAFVPKPFKSLVFMIDGYWPACRASAVIPHLTLCLSVFLLQHADLVPTRPRPQTPTAPNVLLTAHPRRNKPSSAFVRKASTVQILTLVPWPAHVSDKNTGKKFKHLHILLTTHTQSYRWKLISHHAAYSLLCYKTALSYNDWLHFI